LRTRTYTSAIETRRLTIVAALCKLESVMSFFGSSNLSICVRLVLSNAAILFLRDFLFLHALGELPRDDFFHRLRLFKDGFLLEEIVNAPTCPVGFSC
jgi:hypothetical protein